MEELYQRYGNPGISGFKNRLRYFRKKYAWLAVLNGAKFIKRLMDISVSASMLLLLSPLFLVVAFAIKITDGGPVIYMKKRVGRYGKEILFPKFRSMRVDADKLKSDLSQQSHHKEGVTFKMKNDPRVTWIGRIIRKLSIDELPQLWIVLKGDMSLVGPRPPIPDEVSKYTLSDRRRLDVKPGLTSIWAISGRADIPFPKQVELDVQYIESQSVLNDIMILLKTIPAVLFARGAY
ncbi:MAG: sugar transferase [Desulfobacterales bacterium]|nr:sugar transferase [Desulfobacterales bacterium]MBF0395577.1 sugar transferase [Desulfobacterales bacterium]